MHDLLTPFQTALVKYLVLIYLCVDSYSFGVSSSWIRLFSLFLYFEVLLTITLKQQDWKLSYSFHNEDHNFDPFDSSHFWSDLFFFLSFFLFVLRAATWTTLNIHQVSPYYHEPSKKTSRGGPKTCWFQSSTQLSIFGEELDKWSKSHVIGCFLWGNFFRKWNRIF